MSKSKGLAEKLEKEEILKAVLVVDDFDEIFTPFLESRCSALLPVASKKAIEYTLECLVQSGIQETILYCPSKADVIREYAKKVLKDGCSMNVIVLVSESCTSLGDALRDIDNKALIKSDFILLSTTSVCNIKLQDVLKYHKNQSKKDRGNAMTLILQDRGFSNKNDETVVGLNSQTDRLLIYSKGFLGSKVNITMEDIAEHPQMTLSSTLKDTGVAICSPSVPLLFSDNFDFATKEDFIRGLLLNEEVLASRIYCHITCSYGSTIEGWSSYQRVSSDVVHRWAYPLVPDVLIGASETLVHQRGCIYKHPSVSLPKGCKLDMDVVIGKGCKFGNNVSLLRCIIGADCIIEDNVIIRDSFLFDSVSIGSGSRISLSVLGDNVRVGSKSRLKNCRLHHNVVLEPNSDLDERVVASHSLDDSEKIGAAAFIVHATESEADSDDGIAIAKATWLSDPEKDSEDDWEASSISDSEESRAPSPEADDCAVFYSEVFDSLQRGYEEKLPCSNLILEVNSSRYAYNVTLSEVTQLTSKAVFALPARLELSAKPMLHYFKPLFENYIKTEDAQKECLSAFEEMFESLGNEVNSCLHYLYDSDILAEDIIESWYEDLDEESQLKPKLSKFMQWLSEAAEESDEE